MYISAFLLCNSSSCFLIIANKPVSSVECFGINSLTTGIKFTTLSTVRIDGILMSPPSSLLASRPYKEFLFQA